MSSAAKLIKEHKLFLPNHAPVPNRRVLVIDDEPEIAKGIQAFLAPKGNVTPISRSSRSLPREDKSPDVQQSQFEVTVVHKPKDALMAVKKSLDEGQPYALGFFDVVLGAEMDGIELVKQIFELDPHLFAVFVTAYHDRSVDAISAFLGSDKSERWDYINKPFTEGEILQKARNACSLWDLHRLKLWQEERLSEAHQLLLKHERQNAVAAVGRSVTHEFGNLLTHIVGNAELAINRDDPAFTKKSIEIILKAAVTAGSILQRYRRMDDVDTADSRFTNLDLQKPLKEALELMGFHFKKSGVRVQSSNFESHIVRANHHSLVQVFVNLFINSIHAMPTGGEIHVRCFKDSDASVTICVRDTGPGIPEDILHKVTEPLFTTKGSDGSGLGLAICKDIIEIEHQGEFILSNHPLGGLDVTLKLPEAVCDEKNQPRQ